MSVVLEIDVSFCNWRVSSQVGIIVASNVAVEFKSFQIGEIFDSFEVGNPCEGFLIGIGFKCPIVAIVA